ncbi:DUF6746 family protein [Thiomicrospira sp.]|uniref:DUF6746 family protein n=1 Tax=Thiomicrospira sp. TaxID=935 RepID=UPI002F9334DF
MINKATLAFAFISSLALHTTAMASDDMPRHFKGEASHTLEAAVKNFSEYNKELAAILQKDELKPVDMAEIHKITYTLENALDVIEDAIDNIEDNLEDLHKASEKAQYDKALKKGREYLDESQKIIP